MEQERNIWTVLEPKGILNRMSFLCERCVNVWQKLYNEPINTTQTHIRRLRQDVLGRVCGRGFLFHRQVAPHRNDDYDIPSIFQPVKIENDSGLASKWLSRSLRMNVTSCLQQQISTRDMDKLVRVSLIDLFWNGGAITIYEIPRWCHAFHNTSLIISVEEYGPGAKGPGLVVQITQYSKDGQKMKAGCKPVWLTHTMAAEWEGEAEVIVNLSWGWLGVFSHADK